MLIYFGSVAPYICFPDSITLHSPHLPFSVRDFLFSMNCSCQVFTFDSVVYFVPQWQFSRLSSNDKPPRRSENWSIRCSHSGTNVYTKVVLSLPLQYSAVKLYLFLPSIQSLSFASFPNLHPQTPRFLRTTFFDYSRITN